MVSSVFVKGNPRSNQEGVKHQNEMNMYDRMRKKVLKEAIQNVEVIQKGYAKYTGMYVFLTREGIDEDYNVVLCDENGGHILQSVPFSTLSRAMKEFNYHLAE